MSEIVGKIVEIIGPVIDISFEQENGKLPNILDALKITRDNGQTLIVECEQHIGENTVRAIAMDSTDGLHRGMSVVATGNPIIMPVGDEIKGRLLNVTGDTIDGIGTISKKGGYPIHREPPKFKDLSTETEILFTGIKVIDAIIPIGKGQRELIIGDRQTGKTALAIDAIINQAGKDVICIYIAIGQKESKVARIVAKLEEISG